MTAEKKAAYVTVKPNRKVVIVETPYNKDFVAELKVVIPQQHRSYDDQDGNKRWTVADVYRSRVEALVKKHYSDIPAFIIEGAITVNLHTGETVEQSTMFNK